MPSAFVSTYALTGSGKTTDAIFSCAGGVFIVRKREQLTPGRMVVGYEPQDVRVVKDIAAATEVLRAMKKEGVHPPFVVVDDMTVLFNHYFARTEPSYPKEGDGVYQLWGHMLEVTMKFAAACHALNTHVVTTAHIRSPDDALRGGPMVPSKKQTEKFCTEFTHVLGVGSDSKRPGLWKGYYICEPGHDFWIYKDRDGVFAPEAPMNIAEHMRFAGYDWPRPPGFEWMEDWVESVAEAATSGEKRTSIIEMTATDLSDIHPLHRRWVLRDGFDRAEIRQAYESRISKP
jgi:hypothetical protein